MDHPIIKTKEAIAHEIADLVEEKNEAYGDSCVVTTKVFKLMYPDGIPTYAYQDVFLIVRVLDKINRIAHRKDAFGESPWRDIMGYALMALDIEQRGDGDK